MTKMTHCTKGDALVLVKHGHKVYAELDDNLKPACFFTIDQAVPLVGRKRIRHSRRPARGHVPSSAYLRLTKTPPTFPKRRNTIIERVYVTTADLLTSQKKYKGKIQRYKLEAYLAKKLEMTEKNVCSTISQLIYVKPGLEVAD